MDCYKWLTCWLCLETNKQLDNLIKQGACKFTARNQVQIYRARILPKAYFDHLALDTYWTRLHNSTKDRNIITVLEKLGVLYGLWSIEKYMVLFYEGGFAMGPKLVKLINEAVLKLCSELKPDIMGVIDALAPLDFALNSVIGRADGNVSFDFEYLFLLTHISNYFSKFLNIYNFNILYCNKI